MAEPRLLFDIASALVLLFTALLGAYLPRYLDSKGAMSPNSATSLAFHLGNMLSGGVMLSAGFCHLLADSLRKMAFIGRFPIAPFLAATGYLITLLADQLVQMLTEDKSARHPEQQQQQQYQSLLSSSDDRPYQVFSSSSGSGNAAASSPKLRPNPGVPQLELITRSSEGEGASLEGAPGPEALQTAGLLGERSSKGGARDLNGLSSSLHQRSPRAGANGLGRQLQGIEGGALPMAGLWSSYGANPQQQQQQQQQRDWWGQGEGDGLGYEVGRSPSGGGAAGHLHPEACTQARGVGRVASQVELEVGRHDHHVHFQVLLSHKKLSFATAVLLAAALCIHSILEGIALGAQSSMRDTQDIMLAIAAHKGLAAYALGASIVESRASATKFWTVIGLFSCATPLGIAIGYGFSEMGPGHAAAAMSALASGTFLYVAMMEVIPKELEDPSHRGLKMVALLCGFGAMSLLAVWA